MQGLRCRSLAFAIGLCLAASAFADPGAGRVVQWGGVGPNLVPPAVDGSDGSASSITAGSPACAIQAGTGAVVCWPGGWPSAVPPSVDGSAGTASAISAGGGQACAIQAGTGAVVCWGRDDYGQATPPSTVNGASGTATAVAAGSDLSCAIQAGTGSLICWGRFSSSAAYIDVPVSAVAVSSEHGCVIRTVTATGAVVCWHWGDDFRGRATPPPSVNGTAGTAVAVAVGNAHSCAIQAGTGAVICWGSDVFGQATPPPSVNGTAGSATAIAAGYDSTCAVQADTGAVVCWGANESGQAAPPASVNGIAGRASAISARSNLVLAIQNPECSDGLDADGDGAIDHPADPGCNSPGDFREKDPSLICDDGLDEDGDGLADFPSDPGCDAPVDTSERNAALPCDDGIDSDGDGLVDFPSDHGCASPSDPSEQAEELVCDNGIDDDGDGLADFPSDPGCQSQDDPSEYYQNWVCGDGIDNDGDGHIDYPDDRSCTAVSDESEDSEQCDDGIDNDGNGLIDYPADPSCTDFNDHSERVTPVFEVVKGGLDLGNPLALAVGDDGKVYGGTVYPYPSYDRNGPVVSNVFQVDHGIFTSLASLPLPAELDLRGFIRGSDGSYYGLEQVYCPECSASELVKITSDGERSVLAFGPWVPSAVGRDGSVYGRGQETCRWNPYPTRECGESLFRIDQSGTFSILLPFVESLDSNFSVGGDGLFYVASPYAGGHGLIVRFDDTGDVRTLHEFNGLDGAYPNAPLTLGSDGAMYGTTRSGGGAGAGGAGTVFRIDQSGAFTSLHSFDWTDGGQPERPLALARDGVLYGVTATGAVFRIDAGTVTSFPISLGNSPSSALVQGNDCALYGLASGLLYRVFEPGTLCQEIDFAPLSDRTLGDEPFTVSATSSSALPVSFTASGSCTVSGDQVTLTGVGLCTLTASQAGDANYESAPEVSQSFDVLFDFSGFLRPVLDPPAVNRVKAGHTVPIRFTLGGDPGREVLAEGSPSVRPVPCDATAPVNDIEGVITGRSSLLLHAPKRDRYTYLWKTDKHWAGTCQEFTLKLIDGSVHRAIFRFERPHGHRGRNSMSQ